MALEGLAELEEQLRGGEREVCRRLKRSHSPMVKLLAVLGPLCGAAVGVLVLLGLVYYYERRGGGGRGGGVLNERTREWLRRMGWI